MKQEMSTWAAGLSIGAVAGAGVWLVMDVIDKEVSTIVLGMSVGLALGIAHLWTSSVKKRQAWRAGDVAALSR